jgi:hypothetical protein
LSADTGDGPRDETLADEQRRLDRLRRVVDVTCALLRQPRLTQDDAAEAVAVARRQVLELFPGKEDVFELVLAPRFQRILDERWPPRPAQPARVLPFRRPDRGGVRS